MCICVTADRRVYASFTKPYSSYHVGFDALMGAWHCRIGNNATRAHGRCQQAFLDAANQQNLTFLVQVSAHPSPLTGAQLLNCHPHSLLQWCRSSFTAQMRPCSFYG